ncbi:MAG TPA: hypothetical protein VIC85_12475 [Ktedonobacterales bacterium]|jgi:hypothetical protein
MDLLKQFLGSGQGHQDFSDFVNRFEQGQPSDGYSDQEAVDRYHQVAPNLPQNSYVNAAEQAFSRIPPQQRQEILNQVQQQAAQRGINLPAMSQGTGGQSALDPGNLAQLVGQLHQQDPNLLPQILSGQGGNAVGGLLSSPGARAILGGIAAMAVKSLLGGGQRR